jgi:hypothetical protein
MRRQFTVRLDSEIHARATAKAKRELRTLNAVVGRLLEKWVAGEVDLEPPATNLEKGQPEQK